MWRLSVASVLVLAGVAVAQQPEPAPAAPTAPAPSPWKSLQVLPADTPKEDLERVMVEITKALKVKCTHCHEKGDEAAETPMKLKARDHMRMSVTLQQDWFAGDDAPRVTCVMCHRGRAVPK